MAQFSFQIPDAKETAIIDAWCAQEGYKDMIDNGQGGFIANPQTKVQFAKQTLKKLFVQAYVRQQAEIARAAAEATAQGDV